MKFEDNSELFLEEATDLLGRLENNLVNLEKNPQQQDLVNEIFRCLHTIKGSSAMFGFDNISKFAHQIEGLFDKVRKHEIDASSAVISIGLRSADCLRILLDQPSAGEEQDRVLADVAALHESQPALDDQDTNATNVQGEKTIEAPSRVPTEPRAVQTGLPGVYRIKFTPDRAILHRGVKLEPLLQELNDLGNCHTVIEVRDLPPLDQLDPTLVYCSWIFTLSTSASLQAIKAVFMFVEDYAQLSIDAIDTENTDGALLPKLGEVMVNRGILEPEDIDAIRREQKPFGEIALESGKVKKSELEAALAEQQLVRSATMARESRQEASTIRVRKEKLDTLVDAVGELVILQARLSQEARKAGLQVFDGIAETLGRLTGTLREAAMSIRMVPLDGSFSGFQRLVRDLSQQLGKEIQLEVEGGGTELDKNILEALKDPLVHIIRNSADHGIETPESRIKAGKPRFGTISISARQAGSAVEIEIRDDGAGLNLERIKARGVDRKLIDPAEDDPKKIMNLIFEPGFTTADKTTAVSGRGVGMDVVKTNIEKLRGEIALSSEPGKGSRLVLTIPLTLVIIDGLLVKVAGVDYVISMGLVQECVDGSNLPRIHLRGHTIPVVDVQQTLLGTSSGVDPDSRLVIVNNDRSTLALKVDQVYGKQQVVIKPFTASLKHLPVISGATILGDGSVALILNIAEIAKARMASGY